MTDIKLPNLNIAILSGRLVREPELRYTQQGKPVTKFRLATDRNYKDSMGNWQKETLFIDITTWGQLAERVHSQLRKGSPVIVQGYLRMREWTTQDNQKRQVIEIVARSVQFLEKQGSLNDAINENLDEEPPEDTLPDDVNF